MPDHQTRIVVTAEDRASRVLQQVGQAAGGTVADLLRLNGQLSALGAGAAIAGLGALAMRAIDVAAGLHDMARQTGTSVETLSGMRNVAEQNDVALGDVAKALQKVARNASEAAGGSKSAVAAFEQLGVKVEDANGRLRDSGELMVDVAKSIAQIDSPTERVAAAMDVFGKSGAELLPMLDDLARKGIGAARITAEQARAADEFNDALVELKQGVRDSGEAIALDLLPAFAGIAEVALGSMTAVRLLGRSLAVVANDVATYAQVAAVGLAAGFTDEGQEKIRQLLDQRTRFVEAANEDFEAVVRQYESIYERVVNPQVREKSSGGRRYSSQEGAGGKPAVDEFRKLLNELTATDAGLSPDFRKNLDTLFAGFKAGRVNVDEYRAAVEKLIGQQQFAKDIAKDWADAEKARQKAVEDVAKSIEAATVALEAQADAAERDLDNWGKAPSVIAADTLARLENQRALYDGIDGYETEIATLDRRIDAQRRLANSLAGSELKDSTAAAARQATQEWEHAADQIGAALYDAIIGGARAIDVLKRSLAAAFIQPSINSLVQQTLGAVGLGPPTTAAGVANLAGAGASLFGAGAAGMTLASIGTSIGWAGLGNFGAGMAAGQIGGFGAASGVTAATGAGSAASIGAYVGAALPWITAAVVAYDLLATKSTPHSGGFAEYSTANGLSTNAATRGASRRMGGTGFRLDDFDAATTDAAGNMVRGIVSLFDGLANTFGLQGGFSAATGFADDSSSDGAWGALRLTDATGRDLINWTHGGRGNLPDFANGAEGQAQYQAEVARSVRKALDDMDLPGWADDVLAALGDAPALDDIAAAVDTINQTAAALAGVRPVFAELGVTADDVILKFANAIGGLGNVAGVVGGYVQAIYTPAEQLALQQQSLTDAFADMALVMPTTREGFRALVEDQLALGESGAALAARLMALAPAFATVTDAAADSAARLAAATRSWQDRLDIALGRRTQRDVDLANDLASTDDPLLQKLIRDVYAAEDAASVTGDAFVDLGRAMTDSAATAAAAWQSAADGIVATMRKLRGDIAGLSGRTGAQTQSDFAIATAAARAGDQTALARLPQLAQAMVDLDAATAANRAEHALFTARTLASLRATLGALARFGVDVPAFAAGTNSVPADMLAYVHAGERIVPAADNAALMDALRGPQGGDAASLRAEFEALRAEMRAVARHTYATAKQLGRVVEDDALRTVPAA